LRRCDPIHDLSRPVRRGGSFLPKGGKSHADICKSLKQLLQGAALGAFATLGVGFSWGGFTLGSTAKTLADSTANSAVVATIAPIWVDQFQRSADAADNLTALKKTDALQQAAYVEKGGWATMPGSKAAGSGVSQACAAILSNLK
jgi:hypothetical protein